MDFLMVFLTGLTTGGLSCLAVQGGLLASSLANQLESEVTQAGNRPHRIAAPILLFLGAKIAAYTLLGFLLGALGATLQLTAFMRAALLIGIGIFMIGNALRMFNVHPIFRIFAIEPPRVITRFIRRYSKNNDSVAAPLFLGALTVFIPCGITQTVMALALGSGNPVTGAGLMAAFTLGTSPVFFSVAYFATRLGATMEKYFMRLVAVVVLILGIVSIDSGLNLAGSPFSITTLLRGNEVSADFTPLQTSAISTEPSGVTIYQINAQNYGYEPKVLRVAADKPVQLNIITKNTTSCARAIVFPSLKVEKMLPVNGTISIQVPPQARGTVMRYACSMGMYTGQIVFE